MRCINHKNITSCHWQVLLLNIVIELTEKPDGRTGWNPTITLNNKNS